MDSSRFGSTFAPYTPPPDDPRASPPSQPSTFSKTKRPWFSAHGSLQAGPSYQSGGVPTFGNSISGGMGAVEEASAHSSAQSWETRFGWRVDVCAAVVYIGGPITALLFLILETSNDYVRFHAYQSALLTTPLLLFRMLASFIFPSWLQTCLTLVILVIIVSMAIRAYRDTSGDGLPRYHVPYIGDTAERWVGEE